MMIFGVVFVLMVLAVLAMAVGVLAGRRSLHGSCGGLNTIQGVDCMVCPTPCDEEQQKKDQCPHAPMDIHPRKRTVGNRSMNLV